MYSYSTGAAVWDAGAKTFANGTSPTAWRVTLDFSALQGTITPDLSGTLYTIPTNLIRKMRWTYAADVQAAAFVRSEFSVAVSNWTVTGTNRTYSVAGPGSLRIEDHDASMVFSGAWTEVRGNYSGGTIHETTTPGDSLSCTYQATQSHTLYVGLRYTGTGGTVSIVVDGGSGGVRKFGDSGGRRAVPVFAGDVRARDRTRWWRRTRAPLARKSISISWNSPSPSTDLPVVPSQPVVTLATDWDTLHCISLPPERTAWMLTSLNFVGRANHYVGALWFYELVRVGHVYASATVTFSGTPVPNAYVTLTLGQAGPAAVIGHGFAETDTCGRYGGYDRAGVCAGA